MLYAEEQGVPVELDPGRPVLFRTGGENHFDFSDYRQNLVHFDAGYLERVAASEDAAQRTAEGAPDLVARTVSALLGVRL